MEKEVHFVGQSKSKISQCHFITKLQTLSFLFLFFFFHSPSLSVSIRRIRGWPLLSAFQNFPIKLPFLLPSFPFPPFQRTWSYLKTPNAQTIYSFRLFKISNLIPFPSPLSHCLSSFIHRSVSIIYLICSFSLCDSRIRFHWFQDALAVGGEFGILEGRSFALIHPLVMGGLFVYTLWAGYLGWQWRRVRTVQNEINELKKQVAPAAVTPDGKPVEAPPSPTELKIQQLTEV